MTCLSKSASNFKPCPDVTSVFAATMKIYTDILTKSPTRKHYR